MPQRQHPRNPTTLGISNHKVDGVSKAISTRESWTNDHVGPYYKPQDLAHHIDSLKSSWTILD